MLFHTIFSSHTEDKRAEDHFPAPQNSLGIYHDTQRVEISLMVKYSRGASGQWELRSRGIGHSVSHRTLKYIFFLLHRGLALYRQENAGWGQVLNVVCVWGGVPSNHDITEDISQSSSCWNIFPGKTLLRNSLTWTIVHLQPTEICLEIKSLFSEDCEPKLAHLMPLSVLPVGSQMTTITYPLVSSCSMVTFKATLLSAGSTNSLCCLKNQVLLF